MSITITAVMPARNAAETLPATLLSVCQQLRPPDELLFVNDGSTDSTEKIAESFRNRLPCPLRILKTDGVGPNRARNIAIENAKGRFIAFLDADDIWLPEKLLLQERLISAGKKFVATDYAVLSEVGKLAFVKPILRAGPVLRHLIGVSPYAPSSVVVERSLILDVGGFPELPVGGDHILLIRIAKRETPAVVNRVLVLLRQRKGSVSWDPQRALTALIMQYEDAMRVAPAEFGFLYRTVWKLFPRIRPLLIALKRIELCGPAESRRRIASWIRMFRRKKI